MSFRYYVVLLALALVLSVFGWQVSVRAVLLVWILGFLSTLLFLGSQNHRKTVRHFKTYRLILWILIGACTVLLVSTG